MTNGRACKKKKSVPAVFMAELQRTNTVTRMIHQPTAQDLCASNYLYHTDTADCMIGKLHFSQHNIRPDNYSWSLLSFGTKLCIAAPVYHINFRHNDYVADAAVISKIIL